MTRELYGTRTCPYTDELRAQLEWDECPFVEYDVEADDDARLRLASIAGSAANVPVLVEDGRVVQIGWHGRTCFIGAR